MVQSSRVDDLSRPCRRSVQSMWSRCSYTESLRSCGRRIPVVHRQQEAHRFQERLRKHTPPRWLSPPPSAFPGCCLPAKHQELRSLPISEQVVCLRRNLYGESLMEVAAGCRTWFSIITRMRLSLVTSAARRTSTREFAVHVDIHGHYEPYVAKYNAAGEYVWAKRFGEGNSK